MANIAKIAAMLMLCLSCFGQSHKALLIAPRPSSGTAPVTITNINDLMLWLDASQITNAVNGWFVTNWFDMSTNQWHFSQSVHGSRPMFTNSVGPYKRPAVKFDATDDGLTNLTRKLCPDANCYSNVLFMVINSWSDSGANNLAYLSFIATYNYGIYHTKFGGTNVYTAYADTPGAWVSLSVLHQTSTNHVIVMVEQRATANNVCTFWLNKTNLGSATSVSPNNGYAGFAKNANGAKAINSEIAEVMMFRRQLSSGEYAYVWNYLSQKYGIGIAP